MVEKKFPIALKIKAKHGKLQKFIDDMGWTQKEAAEKIGITPNLLCRWINLKDYPRSHESMEKICSLLGESPETLFPEFIKDPIFLNSKKEITKYKEVDLEYLPYNKIPAIEYDFDHDEEIFKKEREDAIRNILKELTPQEEKVIILRFGIGDDCVHTLEETARVLSVTRERIRQIEAKALHKLSHPSRVNFLRNFITRDQEKED